VISDTISLLLPGRYGFRFDDVHPAMDWAKFESVRDMMIEFGVKPLIAVVPACRDVELGKNSARRDFWEQIAALQHRGWSIGMHGYQHVPATRDGGLLRVSTKSEFAGLPYAEQLQKIQNSLECFSEHGVNVSCFVAPFHSYDRNTLAALKAVGIRVVSDGFALLPYHDDGILFVPQLTEWPRRFGIGIHTFCLHPDHLSSGQLQDLRRFIIANKNEIISFHEAMNCVGSTPLLSVCNKGTEIALRAKRALVRR
jgi:predicted deacetylase